MDKCFVIVVIFDNRNVIFINFKFYVVWIVLIKVFWINEINVLYSMYVGLIYGWI